MTHAPLRAAWNGQRFIELHHLTPEHFPALLQAGADRRIWQYYPVWLDQPDTHLAFLEEILSQCAYGTCIAFVVKASDTPFHESLGLTRIFKLDSKHRQAEIGTWLVPRVWSTGVNHLTKQLLLQYCFEQLSLLRVQFRTDVRNTASIRALERLGATLEGILRKERILPDGTVRDAAIYSITDDDWIAIQQQATHPSTAPETTVSNSAASLQLTPV